MSGFQIKGKRKAIYNGDVTQLENPFSSSTEVKPLPVGFKPLVFRGLPLKRSEDEAATEINVTKPVELTDAAPYSKTKRLRIKSPSQTAKPVASLVPPAERRAIDKGKGKVKLKTRLQKPKKQSKARQDEALLERIKQLEVALKKKSLEEVKLTRRRYKGKGNTPKGKALFDTEQAELDVVCQAKYKIITELRRLRLKCDGPEDEVFLDVGQKQFALAHKVTHKKELKATVDKAKAEYQKEQLARLKKPVLTGDPELDRIESNRYNSFRRFILEHNPIEHEKRLKKIQAQSLALRKQQQKNTQAMLRQTMAGLNDSNPIMTFEELSRAHDSGHGVSEIGDEFHEESLDMTVGKLTTEGIESYTDYPNKIKPVESTVFASLISEEEQVALAIKLSMSDTSGPGVKVEVGASVTRSEEAELALAITRSQLEVSSSMVGEEAQMDQALQLSRSLDPRDNIDWDLDAGW